MDIELIDIIADEGYPLPAKRPGLASGVGPAEAGRRSHSSSPSWIASPRCVKDLGELCEHYFSDGKSSTLLSVSDSIDTRTAAGKLVLNVLTSGRAVERRRFPSGLGMRWRT